MPLFLAVIALILADSASAGRPSTLGMTCAEARGIVASRGAVVMSTGPHTFNRFVVSRSFCTLGEYAQPATAPTRDTPHCPLGYTCELGPPPWEDDDGFDRIR